VFIIDIAKRWKRLHFLIDASDTRVSRPAETTAQLSGVNPDIHHFTSGQAIEVAELTKTNGEGISPKNFNITFQEGSISAHLPHAARCLPLSDHDNQHKFWLRDFVPPRMDNQIAALRLTKTNWNDVRPYSSRANDDVEYRHRYVICDTSQGLTPANCVLPSIFCLHVIISFSDNAVLALRRKGVSFETDTYSISAEEQMAQHDVDHGGDSNIVEMWMRRTVCEEVFPLKDSYKSDPVETWYYVNDRVRSMELLSLIHEEKIGGWALVGHIRLTMESKEYPAHYMNMQKFRSDSHDIEGRQFCVDVKEINNLIHRGKAIGYSFQKSKNQWKFTVDELHPTALYRAIKYIRLIT